MSSFERLHLTGAFPNTADFGPSVFFSILYGLSVPILLWRWTKHTSARLWAPSLVCLSRLGLLILRAIMARHEYGTSMIIAHNVLLSIGYSLLVEPLICFWWYSLSPAISVHDPPRWIYRFAIILDLLIYASIGLAIASSAKFRGALRDDDTLWTVQQLRQASCALGLAIVLILALAVVSSHSVYRLDIRKTSYILLVLLPLTITSIYRLIESVSWGRNRLIWTKSAFWILQITFEFLAYAGLLTISIPAWFPRPPPDEKRDENV